VNVLEKRKISPLPGIEPSRSGHILAAIPTEIFLFSAKYYYCDKSKENEVGWACSTCVLICRKIVKGNFRGVEDSEM
jgi:hypothetical protein